MASPITDIRPQWLNVARRIQSAACRQNGIAVVTIKVIVGADGNPILYEEPTLVKIEPVSQAHRLLEILGTLE